MGPKDKGAGDGREATVKRRARRTQGEPPPSTIHDLDALDREIIEHLQENGRQSNAAIARALGVTETTIRHRIERLIGEGFIRITAVINPRKTAYQVDAVIWMRLERGGAAAAAERIARFPNIVYVAHTTGRYDLLVEGLFESDVELLEFLTKELSRELGVLQSETYHVLRTVKINYDWKLPVNRRPRARRGGVGGLNGQEPDGRHRGGPEGAVRKGRSPRRTGGARRVEQDAEGT